MKFKEFLEKNAPLTQTEHKQLNFRKFYYAFFALSIFYFCAVLYFSFSVENKLFYPLIEELKENFLFFKNRYEDSEKAIPGAGMMYFLTIVFGFIVFALLTLIYILIYLFQSLKQIFYPVGWGAILISIFGMALASVFIYMSFIKRIDFFDPYKRTDRFYIGIPNVILSLFTVYFTMATVSIAIVVLIKIIRQRGRLIDAK